ncbi:hypothetical protein [Halomonas caseinilytica]|uniref:hypothetical protein n=1 Tax=Halomonas caseinilytica TaxID=438744 RepID=UPI0007E54163|nr:hypothetical protein [Halomonas caseinilytica]SEN20568.1 hypothetical protein SAMN04487952_111102 [Halomonas caseinilytica]
MPHDVTFAIQHPQDARQAAPDAFVMPATDKQRRDLGNAAVGQAWMTWSDSDTSSRTIKFMLPQATSTWSEWRAVLQGYRFAIRVADSHEVTSLSLPLPEQAGLAPLKEDHVEDLHRTILAQCQALNHVRHIRLLAHTEREAALYTGLLTKG